MIQIFVQAGIPIDMTDCNNISALERILFKAPAHHGEGLLVLDHLINSGFDFSATSKTSWTVLGKRVSSAVRGMAVGMASNDVMRSPLNTAQSKESQW